MKTGVYFLCKDMYRRIMHNKTRNVHLKSKCKVNCDFMLTPHGHFPFIFEIRIISVCTCMILDWLYFKDFETLFYVRHLKCLPLFFSKYSIAWHLTLLICINIYIYSRCYIPNSTITSSIFLIRSAKIQASGHTVGLVCGEGTGMIKD